jgi:hypothetical protein
MVCDAVQHNQLKSVRGNSGSRPFCIATLTGSFPGDTMKKIDVSTPKHPDTFAEVDDSDFDRINKDKWGAVEIKGKLYAKRNIRRCGKRMSLFMHTAVMGKVDGKITDHRSGITLNNQRHNLRHCTYAENNRNKKVNSNNTSGYKGVSWYKRDKKWQVHIQYNSKKIYLGTFFCLIKAAKVYDKAAKELFGEFAWLNFSEGILR